MSVKELKSQLVTLSPLEQAEVAAFLFHLRHATDPDYQSAVTRRIADKDTAHWLTPDELERRMDQN
jgi:hypothetical protein